MLVIYTYRLKLAITSIVQSYVPIPNLSTYYFWGSNFLSLRFISANLPSFLNPSKLSVLLSSVLMVISGGLLLRKPASLFLYSSGTLSILLFGYLKFPGALRHKGHLFIVLIASLWLFHYVAPTKCFNLSLPEQNLRRYQNLFLTLILSIQVFAGIYAYRMDLLYPFSNSKAAAQFIQDQGLESMVLLGQRDNAVHTIVGFLGTQAYYPGLNRFGSFLVKANRRQDLEPAEISEVLTEALANESEILFVATEPISIQSPTFSLKKLAFFASGFGKQEDYYLYLVKAQRP
ncbi:MAG: hypothetical protein HC890_18815 [Chloroflexaceae bacterium]|nr:hypothetical protein [Chloroflexaceae bacterium]